MKSNENYILFTKTKEKYLKKKTKKEKCLKIPLP